MKRQKREGSGLGPQERGKKGKGFAKHEYLESGAPRRKRPGREKGWSFQEGGQWKRLLGRGSRGEKKKKKAISSEKKPDEVRERKALPICSKKVKRGAKRGKAANPRGWRKSPLR